MSGEITMTKTEHTQDTLISYQPNEHAVAYEKGYLDGAAKVPPQPLKHKLSRAAWRAYNIGYNEGLVGA